MTSKEPEPRDLADIIGEAFKVYKTNFTRLIALVAFVGVILSALILAAWLTLPWQDLLEWGTEEIGLLIVWLVVIVLAYFILYSLMLGALIQAITEQYTKQPIQITKAYAFAWHRLAVLLGAIALASITIFAMAITIIGIPFAIYFVVRWFGVGQAVILEGKSPREALSRSSQLVRNTWWRVCGILVIMAFIVGALGGILGVTIGLIPWIGQFLATILVTPIGVIGITILYYDLVFRKEGYSLETMTR